ncbi:22430_t:CDS:1, partial [Gigaspora rosea]
WLFGLECLLTHPKKSVRGFGKKQVFAKELAELKEINCEEKTVVIYKP